MKHGDLPECGMDYATDESTARAYCPHCREVMPLAKDQGRIVRLTSKTMKLLYGQGGRGAPINGRIVGQAGPFPIVQWSNGETGGISAAGIETDKRASTKNATNMAGGEHGHHMMGLSPYRKQTDEETAAFKRELASVTALSKRLTRAELERLLPPYVRHKASLKDMRMMAVNRHMQEYDTRRS